METIFTVSTSFSTLTNCIILAYHLSDPTLRPSVLYDIHIFYFQYYIRTKSLLTLQDIQAAQARITNHVRHTPLVEAKPVKQPITQARSLALKLECLQISGSFKARGAVNKLLSLPTEQVQRGLVTASGGNHGLGVAYAGWLAHAPVTIFLPHGTPLTKIQKLYHWGARVIVEGNVCG